MKIKMITQLPLTFWIRFIFFAYDIQKEIGNLSLVSKYLYKITDNIKQSKNFPFRKRLIRIPSKFKNSSEIRKILHCFSDKWINDTRKTIVLLSCETCEQIQVLSEAIPNQFLVSIRFSCKEIKEYNKTLSSCMEKISTRLTILNLRNNDLVTSSIIQVVKCLEYATSLEELLLENNYVYCTGVKFLVSPISKMNKLKILNLAGNKIGSKGCSDIAIALSNISELNMLDLSRNDIGAFGFLNLAPVVGQMTTLKSLKLGSNWFGVESSMYVSAMIEDLTCLTELNLEFNYITRDQDCGMTFLGPAIEKLTDLKSLNLSGNRLGINNFFTTNYITPFSKNIGLTRLDLSANYIRQTSSLSLFFKNNKSLTDLSLNNNKIDNNGIKELFLYLVNIPNLQRLNISSNDYTSITDISLLTNLVHLNIQYNIWRKYSEMICFSKMHKLTFLDITGNSLKDSGLKLLLSTLKNLSNLKILKLGSNKISNQGIITLIDSIQTMKSLVEIDLSWNNIVWNEIDKNTLKILKSPNLNIYRTNYEDLMVDTF